jgi:type IV pilus biogenesis protein CpaD/CtpE
MITAKALRHALVLAFLAAPLAGCDSGGTTPDTAKPTAPPVTKENAKEATNQVNAGAGVLKTGVPGMPTPKK